MAPVLATVTVYNTPVVLLDVASPGPSTSFTTVDLGPGGLGLLSSSATAVLLLVQVFDDITLRFRSLGSSDDGTGMDFTPTFITTRGTEIHVAVDSSGRFEWRRVSGSAHTILKLAAKFG
jgi:hypothetical protein